MQASLKLSFEFDPVRLQSDLQQVLEPEYVPHFNTQYYEGNWSVAPLRSVGGGATQIYPDPTRLDAFADTPLLARCPYIREVVLASFRSPLGAVRFLRLAAGSVIKEHCDYKLSLEENDARLHIPVVTNPDVEFFLKGERVIMHAGECWYLNLSEPHRVANRGQSDRVHLVIDLEVNDWFRNLVLAQATAAPLPSSQPDPQSFTRSETAPPTLGTSPTSELKAAAPREAGPNRDLTGQAALVRSIVEFLRGIGLTVKEGAICGPAFVPGIQIQHGTLVFDSAALAYPGDLLHEAGHLALKAPAERSLVHLTCGEDPGEEIAAIAWTYAAVVHLGLSPEIVFHAEGYRGASSSLIENFTCGHFIGVPILQWLGLACDAKEALRRGTAPYPAMLRWLRES